ncbi:MAG: hypothetical protein FJ271_05390 [Planctomycetes bacterium]|nr:hypothetical protein [Planctomycetota bacterium]
MPYRLLSNLFLLGGIAFLGLAAYDYFAPPPESQLHVEQADLEFPDLPAGCDNTVVFHLDNRSGRPMRVLGLTGC